MTDMTSKKEMTMAAKSITSAMSDVKKSMEELYDSCRRGRITDIPKLHKRYIKAQTELNKTISERSNKKDGKKE